MMRVILVFSIVCSAILVAGCKPKLTGGTTLKNATHLTLPQLREVTKGMESFSWVGSDKDYSYFQTQSGIYRLPATATLLKPRPGVDTLPELGTHNVEVVFLDDGTVSLLNAGLRSE